jgi:hypothetical protein
MWWTQRHHDAEVDETPDLDESAHKKTALPALVLNG